jgi:hypothetical protein
MSTFYCNICNSGFDKKYNYEQHLKSKKHNIRVSNDIKLYNCSICQKNFSYSSGLYRHRTKCKENSTPPPKLDYLEKENLELHQKNLELSQKIEDLERSKNIQNIENQNNTNIEININCFGNENMDYITDKVILQCISKVYGSIPMIIERIHFDKEHPENNNVKIPNKKLPHAKIMTDNKWKFVDRSDTIHSMIDNGYSLLDETFQEKGHVLSNNQQKHFKNFQTKYEDGDKNTIKDIKDKVELLVINKSRT